MSFLRVDGTKLVDEQGKEVVLHGAGLGGWMTFVPPIYDQFVGLLKLILVMMWCIGWRTLSQVCWKAIYDRSTSSSRLVDPKGILGVNIKYEKRWRRR